MYILCIYYVYIMYILCIYYVYIMYILCIYYVYIMYILCIYYVYIMYILCIYYVYIMYILCIYYVYIIIYIIYIYIYTEYIFILSLPDMPMFSLSHSQRGGCQGPETFFAPSADKQTGELGYILHKPIYIILYYIYKIYSINRLC